MRLGGQTATKIVALLTILLFCFQASRIYLLNRVNFFYSCPGYKVLVVGPSITFAANSDGNNESISLAKGDNNLFRCSGALGGLVFAQLQPLSMPISFPADSPAVIGLLEPNLVNLPDEAFPFAIFQPPRS